MHLYNQLEWYGNKELQKEISNLVCDTFKKMKREHPTMNPLHFSYISYYHSNLSFPLKFHLKKLKLQF